MTVNKQTSTDVDYAIEFGRYLATEAERFMAEQNRAAEAGEAPDADYWSALQSAIYEFRKRADRAEATTKLVRHLAAEEATMSEHYEAALAAWRQNGGPRPAKRPDGIPTRIDLNWMTPAERAIRDAMAAVEVTGASPELTDAVTLLAQALDRVADHVEAPNAE